ERDILEICRDKIRTYNHLKNKFDLPITSLKSDEISDFPIIAKPRYGKGSRDIIKIKDQEELDYVCSRYSNMIFQEYLPGQEFTIDVLSDLESNPIVAVPRIRIQTKGGISTKGRIVLDKWLMEESLDIVNYLRISGPCCIQMKRDKDNNFKLVEINPRLGGGTIFATLAGANFPKMIIDMVEGKKVKAPTISEITVLRYFEEIVLDENKIFNCIGKADVAN
ncbi:MAG: ATP-grasp domain-containing protein, partial [Thermoproteota archaeon]|nr:ATP-grasp domain-containing protein [Thermoproteota archaeon]